MPIARIHTTRLKGITVVSKKPLIKNDIDKLTYYAENDITSSAGDASDVLRKTPMITVGPDGNVSLNGNNNPRILVNGKTSSLFMRSVPDALRSIPASQISRIEIITNPSAKYDGDGSGIINIITKKDFSQYMNGSMNIGLSNMRNNSGLNFSLRKRDLLLSANLAGNYSFPRRRPGSYEREDLVYRSQNSQQSIVFDQRRGFNTSMSADYSWNKYNQLMASVGINVSRDRRYGDATGSLTDSNGQKEDFIRIMNAPGKTRGMDYYLDYTRRFKTEEKMISFSLLINKNKGGSWYVSDLRFEKPPYFLSEKADKHQRNTETTFQGDFATKLGKGKLETGTKVILRDFVNDFKVYQYNPLLDSMLLNTGRTNLFRFRQYVVAGYMQYGIKLSETVTFRAGIRTELTSLSSSNHYVNVLPSFAIAKNLGDQQIKLSYSKRLQRPGTMYLNPFISASDAYNRTQGNPYLQPEFLHAPELSYSFNKDNNFYGITVFYRVSNQVIDRYTSISYDTAAKGVISTTTYDNIGSNRSWGINLTTSINIHQHLNLRSNLNMNTYHMRSSDNYYYAASSAKNTVLFMNVNAIWRLKKDLSVEAFFAAGTRQRTIQGRGNGFTMFNTAIRKGILKGRGNIGLIITEPFRKATKMLNEQSNAQFREYMQVLTPHRSVAVNFGLSFGKLKARSGSKKISNDDLKQ